MKSFEVRNLALTSFLSNLTLAIAILTVLPSLGESLSSPHDKSCPSNLKMASPLKKTIKEICHRPPRHWVGDAFHVYSGEFSMTQDFNLSLFQSHIYLSHFSGITMSILIVYIVFANKAFTKEISPFLLFDYAPPEDFPPNYGPKRGVGQHPHRGFETVTIAFQGEVEHADSEGNRDVIGPGDVQWMTAARGIVHEEFHSTDFSAKGGMFEMCQLWVNLPKDQKMSKPRYQPILDKNIPKAPLLVKGSSDNVKDDLNDGYARIIAGELRGVKGPANTFTPINLWDVVILNTESKFTFDITDGHNLVIFVRRGSVTIQGKALDTADVAIMGMEGTELVIQAKEPNTSLLFLSGEPIDEPIAARGPFVMNTQQELQAAWTDYRKGINGF